MKNKVALITGGTTGIGRATALAFAQAGARVVITGRRATQGQETLDLVRQAGGEGFFVQADVSRSADMEKLVAQIDATYGRLDYAFNNAGIEGLFAQIHEQTEENYDQVMNINVRGVWLSMKYEIPLMLRQGGGCAIVNNSSIAGLCGFENSSIYGASKHAVIGLTKSAAMENATRGIRVNAICPGGIQTEMVDRLTGGNPKVQAMFAAAHPMNRIGEPREAADVVLWLCSEQSSFLTGLALPVDGGESAMYGGKMKFES
jgi:NAD(P)-dependent dehydrogenase (short-subunit alcohol dehydrogenase family)